MSDVDLTNPPFKLPLRFWCSGCIAGINDAAGRTLCDFENPIPSMEWKADGIAYIVAAVNAAPGLVAEVARLRRKLEIALTSFADAYGCDRQRVDEVVKEYWEENGL